MFKKLNPDAPPFFPSSFYDIEDFESTWWDLIQHDSAFRSFWLQERFLDWETETEVLEELDDKHVIEFFFSEPDFSEEADSLVTMKRKSTETDLSFSHF